MKNQSNLRLFLFLLCTITLLNCKKHADVEPKAITDKMVGKYTMSEIIVGGQTLKLPYNQAGNEVNGTIEIEKTSETEIEISYTIYTLFQGTKDVDSASDAFFIKQGAKDIEIFDDKDFTIQIGSLVDGKTLYIVSNITDRITAIKN